MITRLTSTSWKRRAGRRARGESGQTLVEYALIISVVSLGAVAALVFLRGNIVGLFSNAGSQIAAGTSASSGGGGGGGGGGGTLPTTPTQISGGQNPVWFAPSGDVSGGPDNYQNLPGVYTDDNGGAAVGTSCSFNVPPPNGPVFTGVWIYHDTGPGNSTWSISGDNSNGSYEWACLNVPAPPVPQPGSISIGPPPPNADQTPDDGDDLRATGAVINLSPSTSSYDFQWQQANANSLLNCSTVVDAAYSDYDSDTNNGNIDDTTAANFNNNGTSNRCYRVRYRGTNSNGDGPWSAWSVAYWVEDD